MVKEDYRQETGNKDFEIFLKKKVEKVEHDLDRKTELCNNVERENRNLKKELEMLRSRQMSGNDNKSDHELLIAKEELEDARRDLGKMKIDLE